jgi:hypothetical protein
MMNALSKMKKPSMLVDGLVPKDSECPFKKGCEIYKENACRKTDQVAFSCATARGFDLIQQYRKK